MYSNKIVTIGGNIGSGKSTVLNSLTNIAKIAPEITNTWDVVPEPIDKWGEWLTLFYQEMSRYAFGFQMKVLLEYIFVQNITKNVITERSPMDSVFVFAKLLHKQKLLNSEEYQLLKDYNSKVGWTPHIYIYIRTDPTVCLSRIQERHRDCESEIKIEYLRDLHDAYEHLIESLAEVPTPIKVYVVDGNMSMDETANEVLRIIAEV